ncbi:MAG: DUF2269 family protein [Steroidobacteraceae bacterium]
MEYLTVKWLHIVSSTLLFGTGLGSAFYMFFASRTRDARVIAVVVKYVVMADWLFTTPTIVLQPVTGFYMVHKASFPLTSRWLLWSILLYLLAGAAWLPVVWMQIRMRDMAQQAAQSGAALPEKYWKYLRLWIALGVVAFLSLVVVFFLMVAKPT